MARNIRKLQVREDTYKPQSQSLFGEAFTAVGRQLEQVEIGGKEKGKVGKVNALPNPLSPAGGLTSPKPGAEVPSIVPLPKPQIGTGTPPSIPPIKPKRPTPSIQQPPAQLSEPASGSMYRDILAPTATVGHTLTRGQQYYDDQAQTQGASNTSTRTPLPRNSPLKRPQSPDEGVIEGEGYTPPADRDYTGSVDQADTPASIGHAGQADIYADDDPITKAGLRGFNRAVKRQEYKKKVWDEKAKEADAAFGKLQVEPSGESSFDASVMNLAKEWKSETVDLLNNKADYDPQEWAARMQEIQGRAATYKQAAGNIQAAVADYGENIDNISPSTDPEIVDLLNTLYKGGGDLSVANKDGVPSYVGTTVGGQEVSIPISEIATGKNAIRFNTQGDHQGNLNKITDRLAKIKTDKAIQFGINKSTVGWDQLQETATNEVNALTKSEADVRSVLADAYGYDYDDYEEMLERGENPRQLARELLLEDLQKQVAPHQQARDIQTDPRLAARQRQQALDQKTDTSGPSTAGERSAAQFKAYVAKGPELKDDSSVKYYGNALAAKGIRIRKNKAGEYFLFKGKNNLGPANKSSIESTLTGQAPSPVKRISPLKRFTNWVGITK